jgi:hypothetical protein
LWCDASRLENPSYLENLIVPGILDKRSHTCSLINPGKGYDFRVTRDTYGFFIWKPFDKCPVTELRRSC